MDARVSQPGDEPANGTLVLAGCLTTIDPGNAAERMAGMNLGASQLAAHVVVHLKTEDALVAVKEFDATAKGSKALPPLGMVGVATHAAAERKETLNADAKRSCRRDSEDFVEESDELKPWSEDSCRTGCTQAFCTGSSSVLCTPFPGRDWPSSILTIFLRFAPLLPER